MRRLARSAPVPVYVASCVGGGGPARRLLAEPALDIVASPRHASVLLVVGAVTPALAEPLAQVHDQLAHPRATVWWSANSGPSLWPSIPDTAPHVDSDPGRLVVDRFAELITDQRGSEPDLLANEPPHRWKGVGPFGQGGEGMMGGTPYGRPMAMTGDDRDGLALDQLMLRVGPFLPGWPVGLALDVTLQGEIVQAAAAVRALLAAGECSGGPFDDDKIFRRALNEPVAIAELERARARSHLGAVSTALDIAGLRSIATLAAQLSAMEVPDQRTFARVARLVRRSGLLAWAGRGIGVIDDVAAAQLGGPVARAAGMAADRRSDDPSYRALGFEPIVGHGSDVAGRCRQRLAETDQSLALAVRAEQQGARTTPCGAVEAPDGPLDDADTGRVGRLAEVVAGLVAGRDWGEVVSLIASLDLHLDRIIIGRTAVAM